MKRKTLYMILLQICIFVTLSITTVNAATNTNDESKVFNDKIVQLEKENKSLRDDLNKISKDKLIEYYKDQNDNILKSTDAAIRNLTIIIAVISAVLTLLAAVGTIAFPIMASKKEKERSDDIKEKIKKIEEAFNIKMQKAIDDITNGESSMRTLVEKQNLLEDDINKLISKAEKSAKKAKKSEDTAKSYSLLNEANKLSDEKKYDLALPKFNEAIQLNPNGDFLNQRGILYAKTKEYDLALQDFTRANKLNPNDCSYINNKASVYRMMGELSLASQEIAVAKQIDKDDPFVLASDAEIALCKNDMEFFYENIEKAFQNNFPIEEIYHDDIYKKVLNNPRFKEILKKYNTENVE